MDIDGQNPEEGRIALASPIRSDGKRRFFFEEIDWDTKHQKQLLNGNENKGSGGKTVSDQKKWDANNSKPTANGNKGDDGASHSSSFLVEEEQSSDANKSQ